MQDDEKQQDEQDTSQDPLIGLFQGSPNLAIDAEEILQKNIFPSSGWTWKQL